MKVVVQKAPTRFNDSSPGLSDSSPFSTFLTASPSDPNGWKRAVALIEGREFLRNELSDLVYTYNEKLGNDTVALDNIQKLKENGVCVFTGHQLGFMGGPAFTILKGISCLLLAKAHNALPLFWLATEDHDIDEIDHTYLLDSQGNLAKFRLALPKDGQPVEDLEILPAQFETIESFLESIEQSKWIKEWKEERSYAQIMASLLVKLFRGTGLIFVKPTLFRHLSRDFFAKEIENADQILHLLQGTARKLIDHGKTPQVEVNRATNLFFKVKGKFREKIVKLGTLFTIGKKTMSQKELLHFVDDSPELFSTNVLARPVLQSLLFPTAAYVAGPSELAYYHQLKDYHHFHGISMPWVVPRLSATMIPPFARELLEKCHLNAWDAIPYDWQDVLPSLEAGIGDVAADWISSSERHFEKEISLETLATVVQHGVEHLKRRVVRTRLKRQGIPPNALHYLRNLLYPHAKPQERVLNWLEFQSQVKENLVLEFLQQLKWPTDRHLYCFL